MWRTRHPPSLSCPSILRGLSGVHSSWLSEAGEGYRHGGPTVQRQACLSWFAAAARRRTVSEGDWAPKLRTAYSVHRADVFLLELPIDAGHFRRAATRRCRERARRRPLADSKRDEKRGAYQGILEYSTNHSSSRGWCRVGDTGGTEHELDIAGVS